MLKSSISVNCINYRKNGFKAPSFYDGFFLIIAHGHDKVMLGITA
jgi:hypothetical protein